MFMLKSTHERIVEEIEDVGTKEILRQWEILINLGYYDAPIKDSKGLWRNPATGQFAKDPRSERIAGK